MNKKAEIDLLPKIIVLIIINLLFFSLFFLFVQNRLSQTSFEEKVQARRIALMIDMTEKNSVLKINLEEMAKKAEKEKYNGQIISIDFEKNEVNIKLSNKGNGNSYRFYSKIKRSEVSGDNRKGEFIINTNGEKNAA